MIEAKGSSGQLHFDGETVTLTRKGVMAHLAVGGQEKSIPVDQITAIQFIPARRVNAGHIRFTIAGGNEVTGPQGDGGAGLFAGLLAGAGEDNGVAFSKNANDDFAAAHKAIQDAIAARKNAAITPAWATPPAAAVPDAAERLAKLDELLDAGVITADEHAQQRAAVLASI